jgi:hydrogenase expression/formation protein HypC
MCLAVPGRITEIRSDDTALVDFSGVVKAISLALVEGVAVDDYVLVHVGYALQKIDPEEARRTLELIGELADPASEAASPSA